MKQEHKAILSVLEQYLEKHPEQRFTQALFNLNISQFADEKNPESKGYLFRNNYNDYDETVCDRIKI
jgi:hypothetical protein